MNKKIIEDEIFKLKTDFENDRRKNKINGGIGVYLPDNNLPYIQPVVKKVIKKLSFTNFNYLPLSGDNEFLNLTARIILGKKLFSEAESFLAKQGTIGGTNAIYMWCRLIKSEHQNRSIILGNPTWENHLTIFKYFGFRIIEYAHLNQQRTFNLDFFLKTVKQNPGAYLLLQAGPTHNPTGINPSDNQWLTLAKEIKKNGNEVLFDFAYPGLGDGLEPDGFCVRTFIKQSIPTSIALSYSKNMTLYNQRTGALLVQKQSVKEKKQTEMVLQNTFRLVNSNPAAFGEQIVLTLLKNKKLAEEWLIELKKIRESLHKRRRIFFENTDNRFAYLESSRGLFSLLFLTEKQVDLLRKKHAIYILKNSRINFGGIPLSKIKYLAGAVMDIIS